MPFRRELIRGQLHELELAEVNAILAAWETPQQDRNEAQQALVEGHQEVLEVSDEELAKQSDGFAKVQQHFREQIESGWSIKELHRLILRSAVYRQQSAPRDEGLARDPDNRLWWRFPLRRLSAEAVCDAMLAISGLLDEEMYGPYIPTGRRSNGLVAVADNHPGARRRSIFVQQRRTQMLSMLELFDAPVMLTSCPQRSTSTVPLQSLAMLNSGFVRDCAGAFALRLEQQVGTDDAGRIERSFLTVAGRPPMSDERRLSEEFLVRQRELYADAADTERRVWADYCQMLLAGTAALYIE